MLVTVLFCLGVAFAAVIPAFAAAKQVKNVKKAVTASSVTLSWNKSSGATGYAVQQYTGKKWKLVGSTTKTKYTIKKLKTGTTYKFRIRAYSGSKKNLKYAKASAVVSAKPVCMAPTTVSAVSASPTSVKLSWSKLSSATGYLVQKYDAATESWVKAATTKSTSITVSGLKTGTAVKFRVRGYTKVGSKNVYGIAKAVTATPVLPAPTGVKISAASPTTAKLSWKAVSGAKGYAVQKYNASTKRWGHVDFVSGLSYTAKNLIPQTDNRLRIVAYVVQGGKNVYSKASAAVSVKPSIAKATGLTHGNDEQTDSNSIFLSWNSVSGVDGYVVYSKEGNNYTRVATVSSSSCSAADLKSNTEYTFVVRPYVTASDSKNYFGAYSNETTWKTAPAPVTDLKEERATDNSITLKWTASADAAEIENYEVFVLVTKKDASGIESSEWVSLGSTRNNEYAVSSIQGAPIEQQTPYEFKVYAYSIYYYEDMGVQTPVKLQSTPTLLSASTALSRITNLKVENPTDPALRASSLNVSWTVNAKAEKYKLEMSKDAKEWTVVEEANMKLVESTDVSKMIYTVSGLEAATKYYFRVSGGTADAFSEPCDAKDGTTTPAAITDLKAGEIKSTTVNLTWTAAPGAVKYEIWWLNGAKKDAAWEKLDEATKPEFKKQKLEQVTEYQFKVISYANGQSVSSDFSNIVKVNTPLQEVTLEMQVEKCTSNSIYLGWAINSRAASYILEASTDNKTWKIVKNDIKNPTDSSKVVYVFSDKDLAPLTTLYFRVTAVNGEIKSALSNVLEAKTAPAAVTGLSVISTSDTAITLGWNKVSGADGYIVTYKKSGSSSTSSLKSTSTRDKSKFTVGTSSVSVSISGLSEYSDYEFFVSAFKTVEYNNNNRELPSTSVDIDASTLLSKVDNLKCTEPTENSITVSWSANSKADSYILQKSSTGTGGWSDTKATITVSKDKKTVSAVVGGLTASESVYFRVIPVAKGVEGVACSAVQGKTKPAQATVTVKDVTATSVTLNFSGTSVADKHEIRYKKDGDTNWITLTPVSGIETTIGKLSSGTTYTFEVTAVSVVGGTSIKAEPTTTTATTLLAEVKNVEVKPNGSNSVTVSWTANGAAKYIVKGGEKDVTVESGSTAVVTVKPGTAYTFNVIPVSAAGKEGTAAIEKYTTAPVKVTVTGTLDETNKLTLKWDNKVNGAATKYDVVNGKGEKIAAGLTGDEYTVTAEQAADYEYYVVARVTEEGGAKSNAVTGKGNLFPVTSATITFKEDGTATLTVTGNLPKGAKINVFKGDGKTPLKIGGPDVTTVELSGITKEEVEAGKISVTVTVGSSESTKVIAVLAEKA